MLNTNLPELLRAIELAPVEAALAYEEGFRKIMAEWLQQIADLIAKKVVDSKDINWNSLFQTAPVYQFTSEREIAMNMGISTADKLSATGSIELGLGPVTAGLGGGYEFVRTEQSTLSVRSKQVNKNAVVITLPEYLKSFGLVINDPTTLQDAIKLFSVK